MKLIKFIREYWVTIFFIILNIECFIIWEIPQWKTALTGFAIGGLLTQLIYIWLMEERENFYKSMQEFHDRLLREQNRNLVEKIKLMGQVELLKKEKE